MACAEDRPSAGATTSAYDLADRLVSAAVGTTTETYTWSGDGLRRSAATGSQAVKTVRYLVDRTLGEGSVAIGVLEGYSAIRGSGAAVRIEFDDPADWQWALDTWRALRPG